MIQEPRKDFPRVPSVILLEKEAYVSMAKELVSGLQFDEATGLYAGTVADRKIGFVRASFSPQIAIKVEQLKAHYGTERVVRIGTCGAIDRSLVVGDILAHNSAVRGEGTSNCYLPSRFPAIPDEDLLARFLAALPAKTGITWTTDGRYAESAAKLKRYHAYGVRSVEMETAALYVVARVRELKALSLSVVSDRPIHDLDKPHKGAIDPEEYRRVVLPTIFQCVEKTCALLSGLT